MCGRKKNISRPLQDLNQTNLLNTMPLSVSQVLVTWRSSYLSHSQPRLNFDFFLKLPPFSLICLSLFRSSKLLDWPLFQPWHLFPVHSISLFFLHRIFCILSAVLRIGNLKLARVRLCKFFFFALVWFIVSCTCSLQNVLILIYLQRPGHEEAILKESDDLTFVSDLLMVSFCFLYYSLTSLCDILS